MTNYKIKDKTSRLYFNKSGQLTESGYTFTKISHIKTHIKLLGKNESEDRYGKDLCNIEISEFVMVENKSYSPDFKIEYSW